MPVPDLDKQYAGGPAAADRASSDPAGPYGLTRLVLDRLDHWLDKPATRADSMVFNSLAALLVAWVIGSAILQFAPVFVARVWPEVLAPAWVDDFARSWCEADAAAIAPRLGGELVTTTQELAEQMRAEGWSACDRVRFLGGGNAGGRASYVYMFRFGQDDLWYVFLARGDKIVRVD